MTYPAGLPDAVDVGSGVFMRPLHLLVRRGEPEGTPILPRPDSPVIGFMWWHDCSAQHASQDGAAWIEHLVGAGDQLYHEPCGLHLRIVGDRFEAIV